MGDVIQFRSVTKPSDPVSEETHLATGRALANADHNIRDIHRNLARSVQQLEAMKVLADETLDIMALAATDPEAAAAWLEANRHRFTRC